MRPVNVDRHSGEGKNNAMLLQDAFENCGLKVRSFASPLNCDESTISGWLGGYTRANPRIFNLIEKRGKFLSKVNLSRHDYEWVCQEFGIKHTLIADRLGISQQALQKQRARGLPPERLRDIEKILRNIGQRLLVIARQAKESE